jgi:hypothetical protein
MVLSDYAQYFGMDLATHFIPSRQQKLGPSEFRTSILLEGSRKVCKDRDLAERYRSQL